MLRAFAIAAIIALAVPTFAAAQAPPEHPAKGGKPVVAPRGPAPAHVVPPRGGPPRGGVPRGPISFRGHSINPVHLSPFVYPRGYGYRRWVVGGVLPPLFLVPAYYYREYAGLGLPPPEPGFQWVRYGPDVLLVNVSTGQVVDAAYGVFY
jgi:Ni/Co efflux regulator RcnB